MPTIRKIKPHVETEAIQTHTIFPSTSLPNGWRIVRFGDVVRNVDVAVRDREAAGIERIVGLDHLDPESLHIKRWDTIEEGTSFTRKFTTGQVLFGKRRSYQRKVAVADFDGICSGDILVFEPEGDALLPELLPFIVQSDGFFDHALGTSAGSLSPRTRWRDLAEYRFPLPPRDEQRRIAELLWAADAAVEACRNVASYAKTAFVLALQDWTSGPSSLSQDGWTKMPLVECADILDNQRKPLNQFERSLIKGSIPYYGANGAIDYIADYIFDEEIVLLGEDGDHFYKWQDWSQSYLVLGKSWVNNHAHVFRAKHYCTSKWLQRYFQHKSLLPFIQDSASMTRRKLTKATLEIIPIYFPSQNDQSIILESLAKLELVLASAMEKLHLTKQLYKRLQKEVIYSP